jgi:PHD/YefM family antitoxin component YafN of YafNO toxin-antitoxin module
MSESALITDKDRVLLVKVSGLLEELVETFNLLEDKDAVSSLKEAEADVKAGRVRNYDNFLKELRESGEI